MAAWSLGRQNSSEFYPQGILPRSSLCFTPCVRRERALPAERVTERCVQFARNKWVVLMGPLVALWFPCSFESFCQLPSRAAVEARARLCPAPARSAALGGQLLSFRACQRNSGDGPKNVGGRGEGNLCFIGRPKSRLWRTPAFTSHSVLRGTLIPSAGCQCLLTSALP